MTCVPIALLVAAALFGACGCAARTAPRDKPTQDDHSSEKGAGTLLYVRHQLSQLPTVSGSTLLGAVVVGLSNVEVLRDLKTGGFSVQTIAGPPAPGACVRSPIQLAVNDINGDGLGDLVVMDTCGNWVALADASGDYRSVALDPALAGLGTWESFSSLTFDDGTEGLVGGADLGGMFATRATTQEPFGAAQPFSVPPRVLVTPVMRTFCTLKAWSEDQGGTALLYQTRGALQIMQREGAELQVRRSLNQVVEPPYLVPFDAFDHLLPLELTGCGPQALGVSVFSSDVAGVPRALQRLELSAAGYSARLIQTTGEVITFGAVVEATSAVLGVIERRGDGYSFVVYRLSSCDDLQARGELTIDFDWRTPEAASFSTGSVPKTTGVQLLGVEVSNGTRYRFYEYDGYVLRIFDVMFSTPLDPQATITLKEILLHETRTDLAY